MSRKLEIATVTLWCVLAALMFWRAITYGSTDYLGLFVAWLGGVASVGLVWAIRRLAPKPG